MNKSYDIIVWGSTGFTGRLICEYLSNHKDQEKIRWAIAGRDRKKLDNLSKVYSVDTIIADSFNQESLNSMCAQSKLIISTVGPYDIYGEKLIKACIDKGSHYLDLTGEPAFVKRIYEKYSDSAEANNIIIMHCCGFESIPPDLGAYLVAKKFKESNSDNLSVTYYLKTKGKISGGTWASFLNSITSNEPIVGNNKKSSNYTQNLSYENKENRKLFYSHRFRKWALSFPVIDKYIVMKSSKSFKEYGDDFSFSEYILLPSFSSALFLIFGIACVGILAKFKIFKKLFLKYIPSGEGPSKEERLLHWFKVTVVGKSFLKGGFRDKEMSVAISGGDPGYGETSKFISEMALCILLEEDQLIKNRGILTPIECTGELMKNRLENAEIKFDISELKFFNYCGTKPPNHSPYSD